MKLKYIIFFLLNLQIPILFSQNSTQFCEEKISLFVKNIDSYHFFYKKRFIPNKFLKEMKSLYNEKFKIANPHHKFRRTDLVLNPFVPDKRLVFLAQYNDNWLIFYEQGGRGYHFNCIFLSLSDNIEMCIVWIPTRNATIEDLVNVLINKKYSVSDDIY